MAMPRLAGGTAPTSAPAIRTCPSVASSSPATTRNRDDSPQPEDATKKTNSPFTTSRSMPFSTSALPKDLRMFSSFSDPTAHSGFSVVPPLQSFSLHRPRRDPADELAGEDEIEDQHRDDGQ